MPLVIIMLLIGTGLTALGVWEQKNKYSNQQFAAARVVGHKVPETYGSPIVKMASSAVWAVGGNVYPIVEFKNKDGHTRKAVLYLCVSKHDFDKYPEFDIGGEVTVSFFGDSPDKCYLENHALKQTVMKTSGFLIVGIAILAAAVLLTVYYISI